MPDLISAKYFRGYIFQKLLRAWKFSCINKNCFFVKETDTFARKIAKKIKGYNYKITKYRSC